MKKDRGAKLGMPHGTANGRLRKSIIFWLAGLSNMLSCYRCNKNIDSIEEMSIEHKIPWEGSENAYDNFFNISNIGFSHFKCNMAAKGSHINNCKAGHLYDLIDKNGHRCCSICNRERSAATKRRNYCPDKRRKKYLETGH